MPGAIWETVEWAAVAALVPGIESSHLRDLFAGASGAARAESFFAEADGLVFDYSRQRVTPAVMSALLALADAAGLRGKIDALAAGAKVNATEGRSALHMALRAPRTSAPLAQVK